MGVIENMQEFLAGKIFFDFGIFLFIGILGIFAAIITGILFDKYLFKKLLEKWVRKQMPEFIGNYKNSFKWINRIFQLIVFLLFILYGTKILKIEILSQGIRGIFQYLPSILIAILIILFTITVGKILGSKIEHLNTDYSGPLAFFVEMVLIYAAILTILEFFGIKATPFFEIFRVILYTGGIIIAIAIGIPVGLSIRESLEKTQKENAKKKD